MNTEQVAKRLVELCREGKYEEAQEALYSKDANPIISLMAEDAIRALAVSLPMIAKDPNDLGARSQALYGAWLAGVSLGTVGMALHHKLCHTLGGTFNLPHA